jgi:hypothetical protein
MKTNSRASFDRRRLAVATRRPFVLIVATGFLAGAGLAWATEQLRGTPEDLTPVFFERLGNFGLVPLYGEGADFWPGNGAWVDGHPDAAIREWSKLVETEGATDASLQALMNIGDVSFARGDRKQAIAAYARAVDLPVPRRPKVSLSDLSHNEKHQACATLSDLFLDSHDLELALKYADLARSPHGFRSLCASASDDWAVERRISDIRAAIAERRPILVETPNQAAVSRFGQSLAALQRNELRGLRHGQ